MVSKRWFHLYVTVSLFILLTVALPGCSGDIKSLEYSGSPVANRETVTQISTIDAILDGVYDGVMDFRTLKKYGDFGIGTFEGLDGEMVGFDGNFYQIKADGIAYTVDDFMQTPFASVTYFEVDKEQSLPEGIEFNQLEGFMRGVLPTGNIFYAIKIEGVFSYMKTRSVPAQKKPYPPLVEVTKNQPVFEFNDAEGVIVGFLCPAYVAGVNVPGYHLHFLNSSKNAGGHILEFKVKQAVISVDYTSEFLMILPGEESDFYKLDLTRDKQSELQKAEK